MSGFNKEKLKSGLEQVGIEVDDIMLLRFEKYYQLLVSWNQKMNLTGITDPDEVILKHFIDSVALLSFCDVFGKVIDVGTGAGFPGLPLKIVNPNLELTLLDSLDKRITFLKHVASELELDNITFIHGRAEDYGKDIDYREQYDFCVSRAVSNLSVLSEYCVPFVKDTGKFVSYKSVDSALEIDNAANAIEILGGEILENKVITLPLSGLERRFVVINKINPTPDKYPRRAGKPEKKPL